MGKWNAMDVLAFPRKLGDASGMSTDDEKAAHGLLLTRAMAVKRTTTIGLAAELDVDRKTVGNWKAGRTMPSPADMVRLEEIFGAYREDGDPVEIALRGSALTEDRQYEVIGFYKRKLREQQEETGEPLSSWQRIVASRYEDPTRLRPVPPFDDPERGPLDDDLDALPDEREEAPPIRGRSTGVAARRTDRDADPT